MTDMGKLFGNERERAYISRLFNINLTDPIVAKQQGVRLLLEFLQKEGNLGLVRAFQSLENQTDHMLANDGKKMGEV